MTVRVGVAHHLGWAIVVTATDDQRVLDRRRIALIEPALPAAPIHHEGGAHPMHQTGPVLSDDELAELVERVRASASRLAATALDELARSVAEPIASFSVRERPGKFPTDIASLRRPPYEARADSVMYCDVLAGAAADRGWPVHRYRHRSVEAEAGIDLSLPRAEIGPPWTADHRLALAATALAAQRARDLGAVRPGNRD